MSVVGIDLGTTNTVVACVRAGKVHVLADEQGLRLLPSVVSFHPNGEVLVGAAAKARRVIDPKNTVYSHKRLIGRSWGSPEIAQAKTRFAFELKEGPGQGPLIRARGQDYTLPEISAFVLKRTRQIAETALGAPVERAVITVPAHFNELQRASTKVAGRVSGLEVLRILNEPTAAALAYGLGRSGNERVAVYDFGGGTFDCTLLDLNGNVFEVLATAGDSFLGGDDVDNLIAERMAETYLKAHRYDPRTDPQMLERLKTCAEDIKIALSTAETHTVVLKEFGHGSGGSSINYTFTMSRSDLDHMITPLVERTFKVTQDALTLARLSPTSFDKVILVGGSTRAPLVRKRVEAFFGQVPLDRVNPDEVVAIGAAIQAAALTEGARRKSIPAAPPVIGKPRTFPGVQSDASDDTQTSQHEAATLGVGKPSPAPGSSVPQTKGGPPPSAGVSGARSPAATAGRKVTNPGVAPATQPLGARQPPSPPGPPANDDEPSIASFPDLAVPTPFEWFPSGQASSGEGAARSGPAGSERSFGGNTITATGQDPKTMTAVSPGTAAPQGPGFGAIDEPPSLYSTPSASVPSFPSMSTGGAGPRMPSPIGEPEPFKEDAVPGGQFGAVRDMSLVSTSGVSSSGVSKGVASSPDIFGHVSDLSLVSSPGAATDPGVAQARAKMIDDLEDETEANVLGKRPEAAKAAAAASAPIPAFGEIDDGADLPAVVHSADLPSVVKGKGSPVRKPGQPAMAPGGGASMLGKPPPLVAPQPFGPMERIGEDSPVSRTAAMPARPPAAAPSRPAPQPPPSKPAARAPAAAPSQPAPRTSPMAATAAAAPPAAPSARPAPQTAAFGSTAAMPPGMGGGGPPPIPQFGSAPPPAAFGSHMPPAMPAPPPTAATAQFGSPQGGFGSAPPPGPPGFGSAPPPPGGFAPPGGSQPPIFGAFQSAPPAPHDPSEPLMGPGGTFGVTPMGSGPPQNIGYAAPILVDVTPRGLVVETAGGYTDTIIPRNSKIPCERTRRFATGRDMQTTVRVRVGQGEQQFFPQNTFLGEVELSGLRPAPRGEVVVAVTFEVDADGTLRIRARDVQTGQEARATLQLIGVADESSVVMMINRFADQPVSGGPTQ